MKLIAVTWHDNYTVSFITLSVNWYNNRLFLLPNRINGFVNLSNVSLPASITSAWFNKLW
jgi:hypothetical protein